MTETAAADPWTELAHGARAGEAALLARLVTGAGLDGPAREAVAARAAALVVDIRAGGRPGLMEAILAEYGLSTEEGVALMCLAEALLRVPDPATVDALIEDKIAPSDWGRHLGRSSSSLVNASTWALMLTGRVLEEGEPGIAGRLRGALRRLGEPVIRAAVARAMREMGRQFVLGETIAEAMARGRAAEDEGYRFSYDMLGEAARTDADARRYMLAYSGALAAIGGRATGGSVAARPGLSVKLSALHPRFEIAQRARVLDELVPRLRALMMLAADAGVGLSVDAEEQERLVLGFEVVRAALEDPGLRGWDGAGVVVQAYGRRALALIAALDDLALGQRRRLMVRLVKGAYWDSEIKRAQTLGLPDYPVFTRKAATDVAFLGCARRLLAAAPRLFPQFATHNAHSMAAVLAMAPDRAAFEFQRLHGMGERLHALVMAAEGTQHRIYAPVGAHRDLLAYLVRRLLENGANSSFVHRIVDARVPAGRVAACPFAALARPVAALVRPPDLYLPHRTNACGWDLTDAGDLGAIKTARAPFHAARFAAAPVLAAPSPDAARAETAAVVNPAAPADVVGSVRPATPAEVETALAGARVWEAPAAARAEVLAAAALAFEAEPGAFLALLAREAGKTLADAVAELREAVDALRYHAAEAAALGDDADAPLGTLACISPWNFPLAIFTGQIAAALAAGNAVVAKPAEQTPLIAAEAVRRLLAAGVPATALQLLPGEGPVVGAALAGDARVAGVMFTGSTATARAIARRMAEGLAPGAPLIAETGGINAMIVDSTALPEQAVRDILASAFQSAGQRCSALRCLYVQQDVAAPLTEMLFGAMETLTLGDPWELSTDIGPVIDAAAQEDLAACVAAARAEGRVLKEVAAPADGRFMAPTVIAVRGIADIPREVFGPVLHLATFPAEGLEAVIAAVNATGHGLTFGMHSRIDDRVQAAVAGVRAGNIYVNRNQIGAVVGVQPFGGEGLSGTGPKAGGPHLLARLRRRPAPDVASGPGAAPDAPAPAAVQDALAAAKPAAATVRTLDLPGPTGESNRLSLYPRPPLLCLGPGAAAARAQAQAVRALGGAAVEAPGLPADAIAGLEGFAGVLFWGPEAAARPLARALAGRDGPILPLVTGLPDIAHACHERHVCIDTTASGGNAQLLAAAAE